MLTKTRLNCLRYAPVVTVYQKLAATQAYTVYFYPYTTHDNY